MTQMQLNYAVAEATGESLRTVHHRGFHIVTDTSNVLKPEDLELVVDCPFCRRPVPYPGVESDRSLPLAECFGCGVCFEFTLDEVYLDGDRDGATLPGSHGSRFTRLLVG
jgi:hypothetical protein